MLPAGEVVVPVPLDPGADPEPVEPPPADGAAAVCGVVAGEVAVGAVVVGVELWVIEVVVVLVGVVVVGVVVVRVVVGLLLVADTNSVVPDPELVSRLAVDVVELVAVVEADSAVLSWSSAETRFCSAWSSESCAEVESSVARSWPLVTCWPVVTYPLESVPLV
jgi:hypothetical protein